MAKKRPGVMLYFDWLPALHSLTCEEQGQLLMGVLTYAQTGQAPVFRDRTMVFAWAAIQPHIDADEQRYAEVVEAKRTAANRRWEKEPSHKTTTESEKTYTSRREQQDRSAIDRAQRYSPAMDRYLDF